MELQIAHLWTVAQHRDAVASLIHNEFWTTVPGASVEGMAARLALARLLGVARVYFGTDGPGFYTRLGALLQEQPRADFCCMRFGLQGQS